MKPFILTLAGGLLLTSSAFAIEPMVTASTQTSTVVTGGVGENNRMAIEQVENNYNLKLVFTGKGGMYLSDVNVTIRDRNGNTVASNVTEGPYLLAQLTPGRYTIEAHSETFTKTRQIQIGEKLKTYYMEFPVTDEEKLSALDGLNETEVFEVSMYFPG